MDDLKTCGNCDFYDRQSKVCRCPVNYTIPKGKIPLGVKLDRIKMEPSDGEGCTFWELNKPYQGQTPACEVPVEYQVLWEILKFFGGMQCLLGIFIVFLWLFY